MFYETSTTPLLFLIYCLDWILFRKAQTRTEFGEENKFHYGVRVIQCFYFVTTDGWVEINILFYNRLILSVLQHIGPAIPEVSSIWFKLYLYHITGQGPPSLLLSKGSRLRKLPEIFQVHFIFSVFEGEECNFCATKKNWTDFPNFNLATSDWLAKQIAPLPIMSLVELTLPYSLRVILIAIESF